MDNLESTVSETEFLKILIHMVEILHNISLETAQRHKSMIFFDYLSIWFWLYWIFV